MNPNTAVLYTYQDLLSIYVHVCTNRGLTASVLPETMRTRYCGFDNVDIEKKYVISPVLLWNEVTTCECVSYKFTGC